MTSISVVECLDKYHAKHLITISTSRISGVVLYLIPFVFPNIFGFPFVGEPNLGSEDERETVMIKEPYALGLTRPTSLSYRGPSGR